ncbi:aspartyl-phosphate phosphatase Spo0E family protein [Bacillus sp. EB600]|uniref:aspartyl-phosphate phosphatase Spo0E family protein n=1 Tax=Bacillus sp. EB600 TaxID=2806345 RepID=UPI0021095376|nr:aspartyl-phosphate phosphatase Spo0E family protein [Bacillus sp. EB600]MCQ6281045.1 aspartyl-phosphate phosphatase Spo0E family protein [Bacillus sp. EB600]
MIVNAVGETEDLLECIIKKRKELIDLGMNYGLLDKKTIQCSQYLDKLINLHMKSHSGPTNMLLDNGASLPRIRYFYGNYKVSDFKYEAKTVELARNNIRFFSAQLINNLDLATLGASTVLNLIGNGIAAL